MTLTVNTTQYIVNFRPISSTLPWETVLFFPVYEITNPIIQQILQEIYIMAAVLIGIVILVWITTNRITRPIIKLRGVSQAIASNDLTQEIAPMKIRDEVGVLWNDFILMKDNLVKFICRNKILGEYCHIGRRIIFQLRRNFCIQ